jgi:C-terminal processing protease CtpA/Prc
VKFANQVQTQIRQLDGVSPCGWLLDLRRNNGGNLWAMLAGVAPLLPKGWVGSLVFADGRVRRWHVQDNEVLVDGRQFAAVTGSGYRLQNDSVPLAVLISSQTGSAGEGVLVAFLSRPDSRVFGEATVGLASANVARTLPDGAMLFLATAWFADRSGQIYDGRILPDEEIPMNWAQFGTADDDVLQTAVVWLQDQPDCAK